MKRFLALFLASIGWITFFVRLGIRIETSGVSAVESIIQHLSFFTILTNLLVTIYFTSYLTKGKIFGLINKPSTLPALSAFILIVGVVYHIVLKPIWNPEGLLMVLSEILHTLVPIVTIIFWLLYQSKTKVSFKSLLLWLIYPVVYISFVLFRGASSNFYPYPFLDVTELGLNQVLLNSGGLLVVMFITMGVFWMVGRLINKIA